MRHHIVLDIIHGPSVKSASSESLTFLVPVDFGQLAKQTTQHGSNRIRLHGSTSECHFWGCELAVVLTDKIVQMFRRLNVISGDPNLSLRNKHVEYNVEKTKHMPGWFSLWKAKELNARSRKLTDTVKMYCFTVSMVTVK